MSTKTPFSTYLDPQLMQALAAYAEAVQLGPGDADGWN